jgi:DNA-binding ferritin-like protein
MTDLLALFIALRDFSHIAHLSVTGEAFFSDHEFFGEYYQALDTAYDSVAERAIWLETKPDLFTVHANANKLLATMKDRRDWFVCLAEGEAKLREELTTAIATASEGTKNLLAQLADESERREFKLKQRSTA